MPYFITDKSPDCPAWATVKEDGEVMACHSTKDDAVAQMVALSLDEDMEPGGELRITGEIPGYVKDAASKGLGILRRWSGRRWGYRWDGAGGSPDGFGFDHR